MKKLFLAALLPGFMLGSTLSATVNCGSGPIDGVPSGLDLLLAQCTGPGGSATATLITVTSLSAEAITNPLTPTVFSASASITAEYQLTIFGSTGSAFYVACVTAQGDRYPGDGSAGASVSFAGFSAAESDTEHPAVSNCDNGMFLQPGVGLPFTFGQPFLIDGTMSAESSSGGSGMDLSGGAPAGSAEFSGIFALDSHCNPSCTNSDIIPSTFTLTLVPEPATGLLILGPLALITQSLRKRRAGQSRPTINPKKDAQSDTAA